LQVYRYAAFGLSIRSNLPLPGLREDPAAEPTASESCLDLTLGSLPTTLGEGAGSPVLFESDELDDGVASLTVRALPDEGGVAFRYADGTVFAIDPGGARVWATWPSSLTLDDVATYLLGPVMAAILRARGVFSLHAAVVELGVGAVAIAGAPEAGKSTLLAALALRGAPVLTDDVAPLTDHAGALHVHPSYPRVRLWDDSVEQLFGSREALPRLTPTWEKRYLDVQERAVFSARPQALRSLFVLGERGPDARAPRVRRLSRRDAFTAVLAHLHTVWMTPREPQDDVFGIATRIAREIPVALVEPHVDPARLPALCDLIVHEAERMGAPGPRLAAASGRARVHPG
jgi:hypothetical protein